MSDIKLIKMTKPKADNGGGAPSSDPGMGAEQLSEIFDSINQLGDDLRKEFDEKFATKKQLKTHETNCDVEFTDIKKRLDAIEKENTRLNTRMAEQN